MPCETERVGGGAGRGIDDPDAMSRPFVPPQLSPVSTPRECGLVVLVDIRGRAIDRIMFHGTADRLPLPWRRIIQAVVRTRCRGIILLHTHPSPNASPSAADIRVTRRLARMLAPLGVRLCDHVIVAGPCHFSFRSAGLV